MRERQQSAVLAASVAALAVGAGAIVLATDAGRGGQVDPQPERLVSGRPESVAAGEDQLERGLRTVARGHRVGQSRPGRQAAFTGEDERVAATVPGERGAERLGLRFWSAFARYELGELDPAVAAELRATTTRAFARQLFSAPPRGEAGAQRSPAALGPVQFVARAAGGNRVRSGQLVGEALRAGEPSPIAITLRRVSGAWRVAGLGH